MYIYMYMSSNTFTLTQNSSYLVQYGSQTELLHFGTPTVGVPGWCSFGSVIAWFNCVHTVYINQAGPVLAQFCSVV